MPLLTDGKEVIAETTFTATEASGTVKVTFTFSSLSLIGKTVVVYEYLYCDDIEIATHEDIEDENQTVTFKTPGIGTNASGKDGNKIIPLDEKAIVIDTVSYENLVVGETYIVVGRLMDKATEKPLLIDGEEVIARTTFKATESSGSVEVVFTFDSTELDGKPLVVFEYLYYEGDTVATHTDIDDEAQTVTLGGETPPPTQTPAPGSPQTGHSGLNMWLLVIVLCSIVAAVVLTVYTRKRWKNKTDE